MSKKSNEMNRLIGDKIFKLRRSLGMTQQDLSEKMGISVTFLSEIENGHKSMSVDTLIRFSKTLHVSLDTIVLDHDQNDSLQKDVLCMMSALPVEYNESILIIAKEMTRTYQQKLAQENASAPEASGKFSKKSKP